jgi:hypothetical protein
MLHSITRPVLDRFHDSSKVNAQCCMLYALCFMLYTLCCMLYALCFMICALCSLLYVLCSMLYFVQCDKILECPNLTINYWQFFLTMLHSIKTWKLHSHMNPCLKIMYDWRTNCGADSSNASKRLISHAFFLSWTIVSLFSTDPVFMRNKEMKNSKFLEKRTHLQCWVCANCK